MVLAAGGYPDQYRKGDVIEGLPPVESDDCKVFHAGTRNQRGRVVTAGIHQAPSIKVAEAAKVIENTQRDLNIALMNELAMIFDRMGIDVWEVIRAAGTKPFGFQPFDPGPGLGGHCIPIDPFYLTWRARQFGLCTRFIELAGEVNSFMPRWVVGKVIEALNSQGKAVRGSRILMVGLAYKKNVDDIRESPSVEIMKQLDAHSQDHPSIQSDRRAGSS